MGIFALPRELNINMNSNIVKRLTIYFVVTMLIGLIGQLETLKFDFSSITFDAWVGMILKSILPSLVSLKAFFDDSANTADQSSESVDHNEKM